MSPLPETAVCLHCGYSLRGLPGNTCPECGSQFDPADECTWRDTRSSLLVRTAQGEWGPRRPSSRELKIIVGLTTFLLVMLSASWVKVCGALYLATVLLVLGLSVYLALAAVLALSVHIADNMARTDTRPLRQPRPPERKGRPWIVMISCLVVLLLLSYEPRMLNYGRLWLSRSAFHRKAAAVSPVVEGSQWVGLVRVDLIRRPDRDTVVFEIDWDRWEGSFGVCFWRRYAAKMPADLFFGPGWNTDFGSRFGF